ncbi:uncharacterized protein G2W53_029074 [Senna tora]|uniref:Uncharacterized protein n=1 Tax=Senna tora TaxID=362788 RepID=A0A834W9C5_9FABA|nr:uncharacterized protein G2W53_029074 [Senna tora]
MAWRRKQKVIAQVYGSKVASYKKLPGWMAAVQQAMPGTTLSFQTVDIPGDDSVVQFKLQALTADRDGARRKQEHRPRRVCTRGEKDRICVVVVFVKAPRARREGSRGVLISDRETELLAALDNPGTVTTLVQATLYKVAEFFNNRRQQVQAQINAGHVLCEELRDIIFTNLEIARICKVTLRNEDLDEFEGSQCYFLPAQTSQLKRPGMAPRNRAGERLLSANSSPHVEAALVLAEKETENWSSLDLWLI